jgi:hypothetical protein
MTHPDTEDSTILVSPQARIRPVLHNASLSDGYQSFVARPRLSRSALGHQRTRRPRLDFPPRRAFTALWPTTRLSSKRSIMTSSWAILLRAINPFGGPIEPPTKEESEKALRPLAQSIKLRKYNAKVLPELTVEAFRKRVNKVDARGVNLNDPSLAICPSFSLDFHKLFNTLSSPSSCEVLYETGTVFEERPPVDRWEKDLLLNVLAECGADGGARSGLPKFHEFVKALLETGSDANNPNALSEIARHGDTESLGLMLEAGADPNSRGLRGFPLFASVTGESPSVERASMLLKSGADPNVEDGSRCILTAAVRIRNSALIELLLEAGARPRAGAWIIHEAVKSGISFADSAPGEALENIQLLFSHGHGYVRGGPEEVNQRSQSPLDRAIDYDLIDISKFLITKGAIASDASIEISVRAGSLDTLRFLTDQGLSVDGLAADGQTIFGLANSLLIAAHQEGNYPTECGNIIHLIQTVSFRNRGSLKEEKQRANEGAIAWWSKSGLPDALCDKCGCLVEPPSGYRRLDADSALPGGYICGTPPFGQGDLLCEKCFDEGHLLRHARASHPWIVVPLQEECPVCGITREQAKLERAYCVETEHESGSSLADS